MARSKSAFKPPICTESLAYWELPGAAASSFFSSARMSERICLELSALVKARVCSVMRRITGNCSNASLRFCSSIRFVATRCFKLSAAAALSAASKARALSAYSLAFLAAGEAWLAYCRSIRARIFFSSFMLRTVKSWIRSWIASMAAFLSFTVESKLSKAAAYSIAFLKFCSTSSFCLASICSVNSLYSTEERFSDLRFSLSSSILGVVPVFNSFIAFSRASAMGLRPCHSWAAFHLKLATTSSRRFKFKTSSRCAFKSVSVGAFDIFVESATSFFSSKPSFSRSLYNSADCKNRIKFCGVERIVAKDSGNSSPCFCPTTSTPPGLEGGGSSAFSLAAVSAVSLALVFSISSRYKAALRLSEAESINLFLSSLIASALGLAAFCAWYSSDLSLFIFAVFGSSAFNPATGSRSCLISGVIFCTLPLTVIASFLASSMSPLIIWRARFKLAKGRSLRSRGSIVILPIFSTITGYTPAPVTASLSCCSNKVWRVSSLRFACAKNSMFGRVFIVSCKTFTSGSVLAALSFFCSFLPSAVLRTAFIFVSILRSSLRTSSNSFCCFLNLIWLGFPRSSTRGSTAMPIASITWFLGNAGRRLINSRKFASMRDDSLRASSEVSISMPLACRRAATSRSAVLITIARKPSIFLFISSGVLAISSWTPLPKLNKVWVSSSRLCSLLTLFASAKRV